MDRKTNCILSLAAVLILSSLAGSTARAQGARQPDDSQTIQALLTEVRLLRQTLQRTGLNASRFQIIVERARTHKEQLVSLTGMLESVRAEIENIEGAIPQLVEQGKLMDDRLERETDPNRRAQHEFEVKERNRMLDQFKLKLERQREREQQLSAQVRAEQAQIADLEGRLDAIESEIEKELDRQKMEETSKGSSKRP
jgi:chromosome segregation ATPase